MSKLKSSSAGLLWLCHDHDEIRDLASLLMRLCEQDARRPVIDSCAQLLKERVEEHEKDEEMFLHGRMMNPGEGDDRDAVLEEIRKVLRWHDRIDSEVFALTRAMTGQVTIEEIAELAMRLSRELKRHFEYEERVFYPLADSLLEPSEELSLRDELRAALLVRLDQMVDGPKENEQNKENVGGLR